MILGTISIESVDSRDRVKLGDVSVPRRKRYTIRGARGEPTLRAVFEVRHGLPQCVSVHIDAAPDGRGLGPGDISLPALAGLCQHVFQRGDVVLLSDTGPNGEMPSWWDDPGGAIADALNGADAELRRVADIYRLNAAHHPRDAVAAEMGWSRRTASRRIAAARDKDYLTADDKQGKAKG